VHVDAITAGLRVLPVIDDVHTKLDLHVDNILYRLGQLRAVNRTGGCSIDILAASH
jgi:hypothetical protein